MILQRSTTCSCTKPFVQHDVALRISPPDPGPGIYLGHLHAAVCKNPCAYTQRTPRVMISWPTISRHLCRTVCGCLVLTQLDSLENSSRTFMQHQSSMQEHRDVSVVYTQLKSLLFNAVGIYLFPHRHHVNVCQTLNLFTTPSSSCACQQCMIYCEMQTIGNVRGVACVFRLTRKRNPSADIVTGISLGCG